MSKELFETLTDEVIVLYEKTRAENLNYDAFYKELEEIRNKHNISKGEMADYLGFMNAYMMGDLNA